MKLCTIDWNKKIILTTDAFGEMYVLVWSMQKLRHYLLGRNFVARVDHRPLVEMLYNKISFMMEGYNSTI